MFVTLNFVFSKVEKLISCETFFFFKFCLQTPNLFLWYYRINNFTKINNLWFYFHGSIFAFYFSGLRSRRNLKKFKGGKAIGNLFAYCIKFCEQLFQDRNLTQFSDYSSQWCKLNNFGWYHIFMKVAYFKHEISSSLKITRRIS